MHWYSFILSVASVHKLFLVTLYKTLCPVISLYCVQCSGCESVCVCVWACVGVNGPSSCHSRIDRVVWRVLWTYSLLCSCYSISDTLNRSYFTVITQWKQHRWPRCLSLDVSSHPCIPQSCATSPPTPDLSSRPHSCTPNHVGAAVLVRIQQKQSRLK